MNTHFELLWNSVFAPKEAVDLAKQHPNTYKLGWIYTAALIVASFIAELFVQYIVRPLFGIILEDVSDPWKWMDSVAGLTVLSIIVSLLLYVGQRWFWRGVADATISNSSINAAIIAGFALSLVLLLPQYILSEVTQNSSGVVVASVLLLQTALYLGFSTRYFSYALGFSSIKSFCFNSLVFVLVIFFSLLLYFVLFLAISVLSGTSLETLFAVQEAAP